MRYVEGPDLPERLEDGRLDQLRRSGPRAGGERARRGARARPRAPRREAFERAARPRCPPRRDRPRLPGRLRAHATGRREAGSEDDLLTGTADYVAPEQIAGREVDGRADVYSLGCLLFQCLVGRPPFRANRPPQSCSRTSRGCHHRRARAAVAAHGARRGGRQSAGEDPSSASRAAGSWCGPPSRSRPTTPAGRSPMSPPGPPPAAAT